ncbi:MAG TPA: phosphoribosyltransferase family protein [Anaerolineaceae bacterium]|jgi:hypoxanthine phosphoribosyltransferase|nr:phosphoribosyltransferase family protein [Anaerolineaceae bacterium]HOD43851.1 phosphoribosyltransferase family protein [Anaerolineaceae bacterium]HQL37932.1 phosphoribosyltransferase family protein [Anaerolineaceae bacterium]
MDFTTILDIIGYLFAAIGLGVTVYQTFDVWLNFRTFSWREVDKYSKKLIEKIEKDEYIPDVIVCIGRGGSIIGSILSGNIHIDKVQQDRNIPILGADRMYEWRNRQRVEVENEMIDFAPLHGKKVLLVAADVMTGGTMVFFVSAINQAEPADLRTACLVKGVAATFTPDYYGREIASDFRMPWMYKNFGYIRDSRKPDLKAK